MELQATNAKGRIWIRHALNTKGNLLHRTDANIFRKRKNSHVGPHRFPDRSIPNHFLTFPQILTVKSSVVEILKSYNFHWERLQSVRQRRFPVVKMMVAPSSFSSDGPSVMWHFAISVVENIRDVLITLKSVAVFGVPVFCFYPQEFCNAALFLFSYIVLYCIVLYCILRNPLSEASNAWMAYFPSTSTVLYSWRCLSLCRHPNQVHHQTVILELV